MQAIANVLEKVRNVNWNGAPPTTPPSRMAVRAYLNELNIHHDKLRTAVEAARAWSVRRQSVSHASLVILGPYGTGKSHIARACLWSICYTVDGEMVAPSGQFYAANRLIQNLDAETPASAEIRPPTLVIDDVGTEQRIPYCSDQFQDTERSLRYYKAIDYAYHHGVALVITSNLPINEFVNHIGGRAWDRLSQMAPRDGRISYVRDLFGVPSWRQYQAGREVVHDR